MSTLLDHAGPILFGARLWARAWLGILVVIADRIVRMPSHLREQAEGAAHLVRGERDGAYLFDWWLRPQA